VRARWSQRLLDQIEAYDRTLAAELGEDLPQVARIRETSPVGWVSLADHVAVLERLLAKIGPARFADVYRPSAKATAQSSMLRTLIHSTFKLFGDDAFVRGYPRGWSLVYQNAGVARVGRNAEDNVTTIEIAELEPAQRTSPAFALSVRLSVLAIADSVGQSIAVDLDASRQRDGVLRYLVRRV
jgi:hypothetical protein